MSYLKWTSKRLRRHLGAVSYEHDKDLQQLGLNPEKMRSNFYEFFTKKSVEISIPDELLNELSESKIPDGVIVFDVDAGGCETHSCGSCGLEWDDYLLVWKDGDTFYTAYAEKSSSTHMGMSLNDMFQEENHDWNIKKIQKADFVEITLEHHLVIKNICETFGYDKVIQFMKDQES